MQFRIFLIQRLTPMAINIQSLRGWAYLRLALTNSRLTSIKRLILNLSLALHLNHFGEWLL